MVDAATIKHHLSINGGSFLAELKSISNLLRTRKIVALAYGFMFAFVAVTVFIAFSPSSNSTAPWFTNIFSSSTTTTAAASSGSQFPSIFSYFYPAPPQQLPLEQPLNESSSLHVQNATTIARSNATVSSQPPSIYPEVEIPPNVQNHTQIGVDDSVNPAVLLANQTRNSSIVNKEPRFFSNRTQNSQNSSGDQGWISNLTSLSTWQLADVASTRGISWAADVAHNDAMSDVRDDKGVIK